MRNVEFREMDAEEPDLPPHAFDAAPSVLDCFFRIHLAPSLGFAGASSGADPGAVWASPEKGAVHECPNEPSSGVCCNSLHTRGTRHSA